jgi:MoxR-like ATPase
MLKLPGIRETLAGQVVTAIQAIRQLDLKKGPSISETLDWAQALIALQVEDLTPEVVRDTLSAVVKYRADTDLVKENIGKVVNR